MQVFWSLVCFLAVPVFCFSQMEGVPALHDYIAVDREPYPLNLDEVKREIGFPVEALKAGLEGFVYCRILVDESGQYLQHHILRFSHEIFKETVEAHLDKIRFLPAEKDHEKIKYWINLPFSFQQRGAAKAFVYNKTKLYKLESILLRNKKKARLWQLSAQDAYQSGDFLKALTCLNQSLRHQPHLKKQHSTTAEIRALTYWSRAQAYYELGEFSQAGADLTETIGILRQTPLLAERFRAPLSSIYLLRCKTWLADQASARVLAESEAIQRQFAHHTATIAAAIALQAGAYRQLSQYEKALTLIQEALDLTPDSPYIHFQKGLILLAIGASEPAESCFHQALALGLEGREAGLAGSLLKWVVVEAP